MKRTTFETLTSRLLSAHTPMVLALALIGCTSATDDSAISLDRVSTGKGDEVIETANVEFDETEWQEVTECAGYGLCLGNLVAGADRAAPDAGVFFPMQRVIDELFFADALSVSANCAGRLGFDPEMNLGCDPEDSEAFIFGQLLEKDASNENSWEWYEYDYETPGRTRLFQRENLDTGDIVYYLELR